MMKKILLILPLMVILLFSSCGEPKLGVVEQDVEVKTMHVSEMQISPRGLQGNSQDMEMLVMAYGDPSVNYYEYKIDDTIKEVVWYSMKLGDDGKWIKEKLVGDDTPSKTNAFVISYDPFDEKYYSDLHFGTADEAVSGLSNTFDLGLNDNWESMTSSYFSNLVNIEKGAIVPLVLDCEWYEGIENKQAELFGEGFTIHDMFENPEKLKELNTEVICLAVEFK